MIASKDRSGWIGASDTSFAVGNWSTATFKKWWLEKLGISKNNFENKAMKTGTAFEHKVLDFIGVNKDRQILIPELRLRVNLDGDKDGTIYEVKTYDAARDFKVSKAYWRQAQVEMFACSTDSLYIVSYALVERDYKNYFAEIDSERISCHKVEYDEDFIEFEYLPKLKILCRCLDRGEMPLWRDHEKHYTERKEML